MALSQVFRDVGCNPGSGNVSTPLSKFKGGWPTLSGVGSDYRSGEELEGAPSFAQAASQAERRVGTGTSKASFSATTPRSP